MLSVSAALTVVNQAAYCVVKMQEQNQRLHTAVRICQYSYPTAPLVYVRYSMMILYDDV